MCIGENALFLKNEEFFYCQTCLYKLVYFIFFLHMSKLGHSLIKSSLVNPCDGTVYSVLEHRKYLFLVLYL